MQIQYSLLALLRFDFNWRANDKARMVSLDQSEYSSLPSLFQCNRQHSKFEHYNLCLCCWYCASYSKLHLPTHSIITLNLSSRYRAPIVSSVSCSKTVSNCPFWRFISINDDSNIFLKISSAKHLKQSNLICFSVYCWFPVHSASRNAIVWTQSVTGQLSGLHRFKVF